MARQHYHNGEEIDHRKNGCDGCSPSMINGVFCHESGCPDAWRDHKVACVECGFDFFPKTRLQEFCEDCANPEPFEDDEDEDD